MTSRERANLCAKVSYLSYLFEKKDISIPLEDIIEKEN